jgi:hypothetical protein
MEYQHIEDLLGGLIEQLAAVEHERWSHWQRYVHSKCVRQPDGSLLLPADLVARWEKQIDTKYAELDDHEKESDREQVRKYLPLIASALAERVIVTEGIPTFRERVLWIHQSAVSDAEHTNGGKRASSDPT